MKKLLIIVSVFITALLSSCEDFLNVTPTDSGDAGTSITNAADAKVAISGLMRKMAASNYYGRNFVIYGDAKGGDFAIISQGRGLDALYSFNHSASSNSFSGFWDHIFSCILQANTILMNIEKIEAAGNGSAALSEYKGR